MIVLWRRPERGNVGKRIYIKIPVKPVGKARHRSARLPNGQIIAYNDTKARGDIETFITYARPCAPEKPIEGPVRFEVVVNLPIPKSWSKKKRTAALTGKLWPVGKPDADNYLKFACDCLNGLAWKDDSQIVVAICSKFYSDNCGWEMVIEEVAG